MTKQQVDIESIFDRAVELDSPEQRPCFLGEACGGDRELRARIEALLRVQLLRTAPLPKIAAPLPSEAVLA